MACADDTERQWARLMMTLDTPFEQITAAVISLVLTFGLTYLFYPAIVAVNSRDVRKTHVQVLRSTSSTPVLSLIIPAYNEEDRLTVMLDEAYKYLSQPKCRALVELAAHSSSDGKERAVVEWIVVNDGSKDLTSQVYEDYVKKLPNTSNMAWKLIILPQNSGKGAAVQAGMLASTGEFGLMADADGATEFRPGLEALTSRVVRQEGKLPVLLGSRAHLQGGVGRSHVRKFLALVFNTLVRFAIGTAEIRDTQCGFKLFPSECAHHLFENVRLRRWGFDIELLFLATQEQYRLEEVVVPWHEVEGSKLNTSALNLALVAIGMFRDMICVRLCYTLGIWRISPKQS